MVQLSPEERRRIHEEEKERVEAQKRSSAQEKEKARARLRLRPQSVGIAVGLLYATLGIGALRTVLEASRLASVAPLMFTIPVIAETFAILWFLIVKVGVGKNWARWSLLVLTLSGAPFAVNSVAQSLAASPAHGALGVIQVPLQVIALVLLFTGASSHWFKASSHWFTRK